MPEIPNPCVRLTRQKLGMATVTQLANGTANLRLLASASFMGEHGKDSAVVSKETPGEHSWAKYFSPKSKLEISPREKAMIRKAWRSSEVRQSCCWASLLSQVHPH